MKFSRDIKTLSFLEHRSALYQNGEIFLINYKEVFHAFEEVDGYFEKFWSILSTERMKSGKFLVAIIPLLMIMQRQFRNAFQSISVYQSYQSWVLLRPAIEAVLLIGKWLDNPMNFEVWKDHRKDLNKYLKTFQGTKLVSNSLPNSDRIQKVLKLINDGFMHTNPMYLMRHTQITDIDNHNLEMFVEYCDGENDHRVNTYAFIHLTTFIIKQTGLMLSPLFEKNSSFEVNLDRIHNYFLTKAREVAKTNDDYKNLLNKIGLWPIFRN